MQTIPPFQPEPAPAPRVDTLDKDLARLDSEAKRHDEPARIPGYFPLQGLHRPRSEPALHTTFSQFRAHLPPNPNGTTMISQANLALTLNQLLAEELSATQSSGAAGAVPS